MKSILKWLAGTHTVQRVDVPVIGEAMTIPLFAVKVPNDAEEKITVPTWQGEYFIYPHTITRYYESCSAAHSAHPGMAVTKVQAIKVGEQHFIVSHLSPIKVSPHATRAAGIEGERG